MKTMLNWTLLLSIPQVCFQYSWSFDEELFIPQTKPCQIIPLISTLHFMLLLEQVLNDLITNSLKPLYIPKKPEFVNLTNLNIIVYYVNEVSK